MKSAQSMQPGHFRSGRARRWVLCAILAISPGSFLAGCSGQKLHTPVSLTAPYQEAQLWAVVPFINESGTDQVETIRFSDMLTEQVQQVHGLDSLPVNRVINAMRQMDLDRVETPGDARTLMRVLGVDGLIVGTVTAYDPYPPPKVGVAVQLFRSDTPDSYSDLDPHALTKASTDTYLSGSAAGAVPMAQVAGVFDAKNHLTLAQLEQYARGRTLPDSPYGKDIYLVSMELYTQFVSYRLMHDLLASEHARLQPDEKNQIALKP